MQQTAQSWVVWELSHSGTALGIAAMLAFLPTFFLGPWMGVFADRWDRRKVLIATQTSAMILAFVFAILVQTRVIALWHVFVLATLLGIVSALIMFLGARQIVGGGMTLGSFLEYTIFLGLLVGPVFQIVDIGTDLTEAVAGLERTREILGERPEDEDPRRSVALGPIRGEVAFENVAFS